MIQFSITGINDGIPFESDAFVPTAFSYVYQTPSTSQAKSSYQLSTLLVEGHIDPEIADANPVLPLWSNIIWTPKNSLSEYYRDFMIWETRADRVMRQVQFTHAFVKTYMEYHSVEKAPLFFRLLLQQKIDKQYKIIITDNKSNS